MAYSFYISFEKIWELIKEAYREIIDEIYTKEEFWEEICSPSLFLNEEIHNEYI